ncbi:MAG: uncharacterized protein A8A55_1298 [Amphiamblys sp. WSBS2006]|nr:MAG: uncharacterized protein A8A55_1298 [Amphiamblys sp. WSBS2006]
MINRRPETPLQYKTEDENEEENAVLCEYSSQTSFSETPVVSSERPFLYPLICFLIAAGLFASGVLGLTGKLEVLADKKHAYFVLGSSVLVAALSLFLFFRKPGQKEKTAIEV